MHATNLQEASDYVIEIRRYVEGFMKEVRKSKSDIAQECQKLIYYMKAMALKIGSYGLVEHTDVDVVYKTIVDLT